MSTLSTTGGSVMKFMRTVVILGALWAVFRPLAAEADDFICDYTGSGCMWETNCGNAWHDPVAYNQYYCHNSFPKEAFTDYAFKGCCKVA